MKKRSSLTMTILFLATLFAGYGFYKLNSGDWINSIALTVGLLGILLSVYRDSISK